MDDNESILAELRKISAWTDMQRKVTKWSLISVGVVIVLIVFGAAGAALEHRSKQRAAAKAVETVEKTDWFEVERNIRVCNFAEAIRIGEKLIQLTPQYPNGHYRLAAAYVAAGKIDKAREHYAEAARLFPCEEYEKLLVAIDKRIASEHLKPESSP